MRAVLGDRALARWLASELLANAAWAGTLVYAGALFAESYGTSTRLTGGLLAVAAVAYVAGNLTCRRLVGRDPRRVLTLLAVLSCRRRRSLRHGANRHRDEHRALRCRGVRRRRAHARGELVRACDGARDPSGRDRSSGRDDAVRLLRRLDRRRCRACLGGYGAFGATMGGFFLGAAALLARRPASRSAPAATGRLQGAGAR